jgi:hypothetical protein
VTDKGGLTATDSATVKVIWNFTGFFRPVDPRAGRVIVTEHFANQRRNARGERGVRRGPI